LINRLYKRIRKPIKFIHVVRNPYDNISGIATLSQLSLEKSIENYFSLCTTNELLKKRIPKEDIFEMRHEDLITKPEYVLRNLCQFLEVECTEEYLRDCSSVVFQSPHSNRQKINWTPAFIKSVQDRIETFPFLKGYSF
jgi:hypothetical protein